MQLKTMVRSNPGLILIKNGTILNKWSDEDIPDEYVLTDKLENLPLGKQKVSSEDGDDEVDDFLDCFLFHCC